MRFHFKMNGLRNVNELSVSRKLDFCVDVDKYVPLLTLMPGS